MPFLSYTTGPDEEKHYQLPEDRMVIFGREDHTDFQILHDPRVSREHFSIEKGEDGVFNLMDLGSSNGTFLNGRRLESNAIRRLKHGDLIRVGNQQFVFRERIEQTEKTGPQSTHTLIKDVIQDLQKGKGYNTLLNEIVTKGVKKPGPPPASGKPCI